MPTCDGLLQVEAQAKMSKELQRKIHTSMFMNSIFVAADEEHLVSICHFSCIFRDSSVVEMLGIKDKLVFSLSA